jgi:hypothetical protein
MAKRKKEKGLLDKIVDAFLGKKREHKLAKVGVVSAMFGTLLKAIVLTETFPAPWDVYANLVLYVSILLVVADIAQGGLMD